MDEQTANLCPLYYINVWQIKGFVKNKLENEGLSQKQVVLEYCKEHNKLLPDTSIHKCPTENC